MPTCHQAASRRVSRPPLFLPKPFSTERAVVSKPCCLPLRGLGGPPLSSLWPGNPAGFGHCPVPTSFLTPDSLPAQACSLQTALPWTLFLISRAPSLPSGLMSFQRQLPRQASEATWPPQPQSPLVTLCMAQSIILGSYCPVCFLHEAGPVPSCSPPCPWLLEVST